MTWRRAKKFCEAMGGHLVTITSSSEQNKIESLIKKGNKNSYWIGGYKNSVGNWKWVTKENFDYTNWDDNQPDNNSASGGEDVLMVYRNENPNATSVLGGWNDLAKDGTCGTEDFFGIENIGFICEWDSFDDAEQIQLGDASVTMNSASYVYNGDEYQPSVKVIFLGYKLKKDRDYTIKYSKNVNIGKATVIITGKGNYTGTVRKTFKIIPNKVKSVSVKNKSTEKISISWLKQSKISGYEVQYSTKSNFSSKSVKKTTKNSCTITNLSRGKTYYVRIRSYKKVSKATYYSKWSKSYKVKISSN
jgi:hypothetical protein